MVLHAEMVREYNENVANTIIRNIRYAARQ